MLYDCRDIGGFLEVTSLWIHPIHQNLCRTQWPRVHNNIDCSHNRFVYGYVILSLYSHFKLRNLFNFLYPQFVSRKKKKVLFCKAFEIHSVQLFSTALPSHLGSDWSRRLRISSASTHCMNYRTIWFLEHVWDLFIGYKKRLRLDLCRGLLQYWRQSFWKYWKNIHWISLLL